MSEGTYWVIKMMYYLDIECRQKSPHIHVGHMWGAGTRFKKDLNEAISYIQAGKVYSPELAGGYLNFRAFSPVYIFTDLEPFQTATGNCRVIRTDNLQTRLF